MRIFKVDSVWPKELPKGVYGEHSVQVTEGEEGLGVYLRDCFIAVDKRIEAAKNRQKSKSVWLLAARLSEDPEKPLVLLQEMMGTMRSIEQGRYYGECLVHVQFPSGTHEFLASSFGEKLEEGAFGGRVVREYLPLGDAGGIDVVAMSEDKQEALIRMSSGASFRLHRKERGRHSVVVVSWSGRTLKSFNPSFKEPRKSQESKEPRRRRQRRGRSPATATLSEACPALAEVVTLAERRQG